MSETPPRYRQLTHDERRVLRAFVEACSASIVSGFAVERVLARDLDDGGWGSFAICVDGVEATRGVFASEMQYSDADGAPVLVSFYVSDAGVPASVEFWRVGDGARQCVPDVLPVVVLARDVR
jgi:hypothetical protein